MSVIFEALKKVRQSEMDTFDQEAKDSPPANVYTIRGLLFSPQGILGMTIFILLLGALVYYGASYLGDVAARQKITNSKAQKERVAYIPPEDSQDTSEEVSLATSTVPPPPQQADYQKAQPGVLYLPAKVAATGDKPKGPRAVLTERASSPKAAPVIEGNEQRSTAEKNPFKEPETLKEARILEKPDFGKAFTKSNSGHPNSRTQSQVKESVTASIKLEAKRVTPEHSSQAPVILSKRGAGEVSVLASGEKPGGQEIGVTESALKTAQISQVVSRVQGAMAMGDEEAVDNLMPRLESLKGENDPFVLKLKAFWLMKKGRYQDASRFLIKVMERLPSDLEAGINMAIVEIKTGQVDRARKRLRSLREIYQDNTQIPELLRKING
ncbi:MAG: hypothetical protein DRH12_16850 [Deltaproteobacteria bacterium]|nr:MAG: hypothetical protein DRH12_16850 [Deltaproteobacteria bacterium]